MSAGAPFPSVSVCLLNYRGGAFVDRCLDALRRLDPAPSEIVAVDNASLDGSLELLRARATSEARVPLRVVEAPSNLGYAGGHNLGARHARSEYLAFLNMTVEVEPGWLEVVRWMAEQPDVAFAQPAIFHRGDPSRLESLGCLLSPNGDALTLGRNYREARPAPGGLLVAEVLAVLGAAFVARRSVFDELGGFDESMFMYFEETDLCWRGWLRGHRSVCWFDPDRPTRAFHTVHGTVPASFPVRRYWERNRTLSMIRNLETRNLWRVGLNVGRVASESARRPAGFARYVADVVAGLPRAGQVRRVVQAHRRLPDRRLLGLRPPEDLARRFAAPAAV